MPIADQISHATGFAAATEGFLQRVPFKVVDLGSGGGVPGLVLAAHWPSANLTLLDSNERRTNFLVGELSEWGAGSRVAVLRGRAEELGHDEALRSSWDLVTARSFGPPAVTAECAAPLCRLGGVIVVSDPPEELPGRWPAEGLELLGLVRMGRYRHLDRFNYQMLQKIAETPIQFPRRVGIPSKRPLF